MNYTIFPNKLKGIVSAVPSKSQAHRLLICAALADKPTTIKIGTFCDDLMSTIGCISGFGAGIESKGDDALTVFPILDSPASAEVYCGESGSTLRFLLPIAGALGIETKFHLAGRLPERPLSPLWEEMEHHGCKLSRCSDGSVLLGGKLRPGHFSMNGGVSSQFTSGLLMALPLLDAGSRLALSETPESKPYIQMTLDVLSKFGVFWNNFYTNGNQKFQSPGEITVEGDWSSAAFWLAANALGSDVIVTGLDAQSTQGDRDLLALLPLLKSGNPAINASDIPDLIPVLAVVAAANQGATFQNIRRLRLKESDRVQSILSMIRSLGGSGKADENTMTIHPKPLSGGTVDTMGDHRIAMSAAIASTVCTRSVTILGAECVSKSYPGFWEVFTRLGG